MYENTIIFILLCKTFLFNFTTKLFQKFNYNAIENCTTSEIFSIGDNSLHENNSFFHEFVICDNLYYFKIVAH